MSIEIIAIKPEVEAYETLEVATSIWDNLSRKVVISFSAGRAFKHGDSETNDLGSVIARGMGIYNQPNVMRFYPETQLQEVCIEAILKQKGWAIAKSDEVAA